MKEKFKKLEIHFVGEFGWSKFRDLFVLKLIECKNEKELEFLIKALLGSMFSDEKEIDKYRKRIGIKLLEEKEKEEIRKKIK